ncbi:Small secreted domain [Streptomyces zhaozhouensis]|uniref:Small secreted domain n=1 Tax=Streptomyces zhaozhouensis TaxID=1300267 RepID=A0A286DSK6_9ACTN|nr:chaplin [Streptomyces zhaozhouensis]SOD61544.1 Small secreted domain [Streptomyces zhaozhouensis]
MRQVTRNGLLTVFAAGGVLAATGGIAFADSEAEGGAANSPGVVSGNSVQAPVHVPVNVCGNTINVVGLLNPAFGNTCVNEGGGAHASGGASNSPGVISGNNIQAPIEVPVNACGNSVDVVGVGNPASGNECVNGAAPQERAPHPEQEPEEPKTPAEEPEQEPEGPSPELISETTPVEEDTPVVETQLAATGGNFALMAAVPVGAGLVLGGTLLYRRTRTAQQG